MLLPFTKPEVPGLKSTHVFLYKIVTLGIALSISVVVVDGVQVGLDDGSPHDVGLGVDLLNDAPVRRRLQRSEIFSMKMLFLIESNF